MMSVNLSLKGAFDISRVMAFVCLNYEPGAKVTNKYTETLFPVYSSFISPVYSSFISAIMCGNLHFSNGLLQIEKVKLIKTQMFLLKKLKISLKSTEVCGRKWKKNKFMKVKENEELLSIIKPTNASKDHNHKENISSFSMSVLFPEKIHFTTR